MKETTRLPNSYDTTTFNELIFVNHPMGIGVQCIVQYPNGYGASVVKGEHTYGGRDGLYELAVFGKDGQITYNTPVTDDVLGYLTENDVEKILIDIKNLENGQ
jgi:hypothetical protein